MQQRARLESSMYGFEPAVLWLRDQWLGSSAQRTPLTRVSKIDATAVSRCQRCLARVSFSLSHSLTLSLSLSLSLPFLSSHSRRFFLPAHTIHLRPTPQYPITIRSFIQMCEDDIAKKTEEVCGDWFQRARDFVQDYIAGLRSKLTDRLLELVDANARQGTVESDAEHQDFHTFYMSLTSVGKTYITMQSALRRIRFEKGMQRIVAGNGEEVSWGGGG